MCERNPVARGRCRRHSRPVSPTDDDDDDDDDGLRIKTRPAIFDVAAAAAAAAVSVTLSLRAASAAAPSHRPAIGSLNPLVPGTTEPLNPIGQPAETISVGLIPFG